jgi:hypothetical protein
MAWWLSPGTSLYFSAVARVILHHYLPHSPDFDVLTGKVPEVVFVWVVECNKYARIHIEQFPNCGQRFVVRLHQKKSGQRRPFVMELCSVRVIHVASFHDQVVVFWAIIPRRVIIPHVSMEPAVSVFMVTALGSSGYWSASGRLCFGYMKSLWRWWPIRAVEWEGEMGENRELEVKQTKAIKRPFVFFLFLNYCIQCGPDIQNMLDVDRMF